MKYYIKYILITIQLIFSNSKSNSSKDHVIFAQLPYCNIESLKNSTCNICEKVKEKGFNISHIESFKNDDVTTNMIISTNDEEIIVSFGGPKSTDFEYLQNIYKKGVSIVSLLDDIIVENEFWNVYYNFRSSMIEHLSKEKKVTFVGHSFGGSIAYIASYDMIINGILERNSDGPKIYTYGALKIGNEQFFSVYKKKLSKLVNILVYKNDYYSMVPRCVFIKLGEFHCYKNYVTLVENYPKFAQYYMSYSNKIKTSLIKSIPNVVTHISLPKVIASELKPNLAKKITINKAYPPSNEIVNNDNSINNNDSLLIKDVNNKKNNKLLNKIPFVESENDKIRESEKNLVKHLDSNKDVNIVKNHKTLDSERKIKSNLINNNQNGQQLNSHFSHLSTNTERSVNSVKNNKNLIRNSSIDDDEKKKKKIISFMEKSSDMFDECEKKNDFFLCTFDQKVHQTYYDVNIEECE